MINQRMLDYISEKNIRESILKREYRTLVTMRLYRDKVDAKMTDLAHIDAIDMYIYKAVLHREDVSQFREYFEYLYAVFKGKPEVIYDCILFKNEVVHKIFTANQVAEIKQYQQLMPIALKKVSVDLLKPGNTISSDVLRVLENNFDNNAVSIQLLIENIYKYLLDNQAENNNYYAKEFIMRYTAYLASKDLEIPPTSVYLSDYDIDDKELTKKNLGANYGNTGLIYVNKNSLLNSFTYEDGISSIARFMMTVSHEVRHSYQAYSLSKGDITLPAFQYLQTILFRDKNLSGIENEYMSNYVHNEIENDANEYGWRHTRRLLKKFSPKNKVEINNTASYHILQSAKKYIATKNSKKYQYIPKEIFNATLLSEIVKNNPKLLNKYHILKYIYRADGSLKEFIELLETEDEMGYPNCIEFEKIISDYCYTYISTGYLDQVDIFKLSAKEQNLLFEKIARITFDELNKLKETIKVYNISMATLSDERKQKEFKKSNKFRINIIKRNMAFLNDNALMIDKLIEVNRRSGEHKMLAISIGQIDMIMPSIYSYLDRMEGFGITPDNDLYDDLCSLKEVKYSGKYGRR